MQNSLKPHNPGAVAGIVCLLFAMCLHGQAAEDPETLDIIERNDGQAVRPTKIVKDDIMYVVGNHGVKVASYDIRRVLYADRDQRYDRALQSFDEGKFTTAARWYRLALEQMQNVKWAAEYCNYGIALSFFRAGIYTGYEDRTNFKYQPTSAYLKRALAANPESRFKLEMLVMLAVCLSEEGQLDEGEAAFNDAEAKIKDFRDKSARIDPQFRNVADQASARAALGMARLHELRGDKAEETAKGSGSVAYGKSLDTYKSAQIRTAKFSDMKAEAVNGELRLLQKMENYDGAKDRAQLVIDQFKEEADPTLIEMLPACYSVMGQSNYMKGIQYLAQRQELQAIASFSEARWNFLHVVVQFFDDDEYVAKSHYFAGLCYDQLKKNESDAAEKAKQHWLTIVRNYPTSNFVKLANDKLAEVGVATPENKAPVAGAEAEL